MFYRLNKDGTILDSADWKYSDDCLETDKNIVNAFDGKLVFEEETQTQEYLDKKQAFENKQNAYNEISQIKENLKKWKEDVEQVELFGMERTDYEEKKLACKNAIERLRELESQLKSTIHEEVL